MMPRTLLARTFLLLAILVLLTTVAWLSLFRFIDAEPRARETAQLATSAVNLIRAALFAAAPEKRLALLNDLSTREGMRLLPAETEDRVEPMPDNRFMNLIRQELALRLGPQTRIAAEVDGIPGFWVSFRFSEQDDDEYWLILPRERAKRSIANQWLSWGLLALALALAVAWFIATRISRPLKALASSAATVGRGQMPEPLPETGADELRSLAGAFNRMAADLQRNERDRSEVLAGISHDLRTPLTRLRLEAEMSVADEGARAAVVADIEQMEAIISQFMDYARADQGEAAINTDLGALLSSLAERQHCLGHPLQADIPEHLPEIHLRPKALTRALTNLIDNAWKYGGTEITLRASIQSGWLHLEIGDNGPGIPEGEIERLKRPFTRLENARTNASGTGLGLAIVERVARAHGGRLELLAKSNGGLLARLSLPLSS
jgi:two-component system osmolarity sensor histidine kinase EnvZ